MLVQHKENKKLYAMKTIPKKRIKKTSQFQNILNEKAILQQNDHPFVVNLEKAFQTESKLYMVMPFYEGGELFVHLGKQPGGRFTESQAKFFSAEILLALEYLHSKNIIYRDLKPENIIMDQQGHVCLTDFGLSKYIEGRTGDEKIVGTIQKLA